MDARNASSTRRNPQRPHRRVGTRLRSGKNQINLKGRTVIPGLIEGHVHVVSLANRPGHHVSSSRRRTSPRSRRCSPRGGRRARRRVHHRDGRLDPNFFAERRLPTLAELDAAVHDRPVFLYQGGGGPARTNSLGKAFFESVSDALAGPVIVGADGAIPTGNPNMANRALYHLRVRQTFEDKKRARATRWPTRRASA